MRLDIRRGDIFYIEWFGGQVGSEQRSGRPGVVVSCNENNRHSETIEIAYCTTRSKTNLPTHVEILSTGRLSTVLCEQISTVSVERLGTYIGQCTTAEMRDIDIAVATSLGLKNYPGLIDRLKEREIELDKPDAAVGSMEDTEIKEEQTRSAEELDSIKSERDIYRRLYEDLIGRLIHTGA